MRRPSAKCLLDALAYSVKFEWRCFRHHFFPQNDYSFTKYYYVLTVFVRQFKLLSSNRIVLNSIPLTILLFYNLNLVWGFLSLSVLIQYLLHVNLCTIIIYSSICYLIIIKNIVNYVRYIVNILLLLFAVNVPYNSYYYLLLYV